MCMHVLCCMLQCPLCLTPMHEHQAPAPILQHAMLRVPAAPVPIQQGGGGSASCVIMAAPHVTDPCQYLCMELA